MNTALNIIASLAAGLVKLCAVAFIIVVCFTALPFAAGAAVCLVCLAVLAVVVFFVSKSL